MMGMMMHSWKDLDCKMENQGDKLVITIKGEKEKIAKIERKFKAMRELCCAHEENNCC